MRAKYVIVAAILAAGLGVSGLRADDAAPAAPPAATATPTITRVNLHLQAAMAQDAFDELAKQGGIKFSTNGNIWNQNGMETENDIDMTNRPLWSAVNEVCGLWGLSVQPSNMYGGGMIGGGNNPNRIMLVNFRNGNGIGQKSKVPVFESDGFLVQAVSFNRQQNVNYAMSQQSQDVCSVELMVFVDPAMHVSSLNQNLKVDDAVDDAGNSMVAGKNNIFYGGQQQRSLVYQCNVPLKYPANAGKKIAHLKCTISMRASDAVDSLSVDKPLEAAETTKDFGDTSVTFHSLKKIANGMYELKIGITRDDQGGNNAWNLVQTAQLLDSKGRAYNNNGGGGGGQGDMADYTVNYQPINNGQVDDSPAGEPAKWVLELPTKSHTIKLPVEFKDLPLP